MDHAQQHSAQGPVQCHTRAVQSKAHTVSQRVSGTTRVKLIFYTIFDRPTGFKYRDNFEFTSELSCGQPAPPLLLSSLTFTHVHFEVQTFKETKFKLLLQEKSAHYPALTKVKSIIASSNFSGNVFPLTRVRKKFLHIAFLIAFPLHTSPLFKTFRNTAAGRPTR